MSDKHKCPTCGSLVTVSTADEGTSCFMPVQNAVSLAEVIEVIEIAKTKTGNRNGMMSFGMDMAIKDLEQRFGDNQ